jgi:hypothetical protein
MLYPEAVSDRSKKQGKWLTSLSAVNKFIDRK